MQDTRKASVEERREIRRQAAQAEAGKRRVREDAHGVRCLFCPGTAFRRSKLRSRDFFHLLMLRYPVRCLRCSQRQYASFPVAGLSVPSSVRHQRAPQPQETWKTWTNGASEDAGAGAAHLPSYTPYTTVKLAQNQGQKKSSVQAQKPQKKRDEDDAIW